MMLHVACFTSIHKVLVIKSVRALVSVTVSEVPAIMIAVTIAIVAVLYQAVLGIAGG